MATESMLRHAFHIIQAETSQHLKVPFDASVDTDSDTHKNGKSVFDNVGGNLLAKQALEDALVLDPTTRQVMKRFGLSCPAGVLLYGPPGTGKTLMARAVANLLRASLKQNNHQESLGGPFISMTSTDLVRAEVGTGEKILAAAFETAIKNAPSVIFLDEFQAIFTERSRGGSGKLATTLLQCLDDTSRWLSQATNESDHRRVLVLAATNTPWMIDAAFLRPVSYTHLTLPTKA